MTVTSRGFSRPRKPAPLLSANDLIPDRALTETDQDRLDHAPIASRVAELIASADPPVNVALFGAWGSGKSSFAELLKRALGQQTRATCFARYDAWTSGGESLQRSFISQTATALGFKRDTRKGHDFHAGLYERTRRVGVSGARVGRFLFALVVGGIVVFLTIGALAVAISRLTGTDLSALTLPDFPDLPGWVTASGIGGLLVAMLRELLGGAKLDVETSAPTQEQFRDTFRDLVARTIWANRRQKVDRVVFFIDELDRCTPDQVVEVLSALKHFLDQPSCIFVVAADREVMEQALKRLPQATPANLDAPYYSSASEFIDKIFQYQIPLPPLRLRRLSRFIRELVEPKRAGLWAELARDPDRGLRDEVLYILVPRHVRSPRRVKVLLNNFATSARIAQGRGIDWLDHAREIAKLTAIQTEFPHLAADLHWEPRLPGLLLNPPEAASGRLKRLLERHRLPLDDGDDGPMTATDQIISTAGHEELKAIQRLQLLRYLRGTQAYPDPGHDLLFLEDASKAVDLKDVGFAASLEATAIENPEAVVQAAAEQSDDSERVKALRVLADLINEEVGRERANVTTALLGIARLLNFDISACELEVVSSLRVQLRNEGFDPEHLPAVFSIGVSANARDLYESALADERLWTTPEAVGEVAAVADRLPDDARETIWERVAEAYKLSEVAIAVPLARLDPSVAEDMLDDDGVRDAIDARLAAASEPPGDPATAMEALFDAIKSRSDGVSLLNASLIWDLLLSKSPTGYQIALDHVALLDEMDDAPGPRNGCALRALSGMAPLRDFATWSSRLTSTGDSDWVTKSDEAIEALSRTFAEWQPGVGLPDVVPVLARLIDPDHDEKSAGQLAGPLSAALGDAAWWATNEDRNAQEELHNAAAFMSEIGPRTAGVVSSALRGDLERALTAVPRTNSFQRATRTAAESATHLGDDDLAAIGETLASISVVSPLDIALVSCRLRIASEARRRGLNVSVGALAISPSDLALLDEESSWEADLERWAKLNPSPPEMLEVLGPRVGMGAPHTHRLVGEWGAKRSAAERTDVLIGLLDAAADISRWVGAIGAKPLEESRFVSILAQLVRGQSRADDRTGYLHTLAAYRPTADEPQREIAQLVIWLLDRETKVDFNNAMLTLPALGRNHASTAALDAAFKRAGDRGYEPRGTALEHLHRAGVTLTKKRMSNSLWERWRAFRS